LSKRGQDVIGSDGRCHLPNNHSKYRTSGTRACSGTPVNAERQHSGSRIEPPQSLARHTLDNHA